MREAAGAALIDLVRRVARDEIMPRFRNLAAAEIATKSGPDDLVTIADRRAEAAIAAGIDTILPGAVVVGEEACADRPDLVDAIDGAETCVIVDPIDGTANFATGLAVFGVIVAVVQRGKTAFGLLYDPVMDDWVAAREGGGAWYGRPETSPRRLSTRARRPLRDAHGYLSLHRFDAAVRLQVAARLPSIGVTRSLRCSCHEYRMLAMGQADFAISPDLKPWDHAAGALVLHEAGGATLVNGSAYAPRMRTGPILAMAAPADRDALTRHFDMLDLEGRTRPTARATG